MAFNHRKLYEEQNGTDGNEPRRLPCFSFCDKRGCFSTCPPPDLFPHDVSPPPPLSYGDQAKRSQHLSPIIIILIAGLGGVFLLASYYMILVKYCRNTSRRRRPPQAENTHEDFLDENHGPGLDNPIWYITTVGLQQSVINSIAICKYKKGEGLIEGTDCSVCLSEFQEDETLRLLPKCSHAFHLPCIDTWLTSHKNCPLCRAPIVSQTDGSPLSSAEPSYNNSGSGEVTQVENFATNGGFGNDPMREGGVSDIRIEVESEVELQGEDGRGDTKEVIVPCPHVNGVIQVLSDLGDKHRVVEDGIQPLRRSVSIDSSSAAMIYLAFAEGASPTQSAAVEKSNLEIAPKQSSGSPNTFKLMGSSSGRKSLQKRPLSMKRSLSCGRKFLLSRYSRSRNSILPL